MILDGDKNGDNDNWSEYRRLVINELERLDQALTKLAEAMLSHEREVNSYKEYLIDRLNNLKEASLEKMREIVKHTKDELEDQERQDIIRLHDRVNLVENDSNKLAAEVKVLKGKAALLGFVAGLIVAVMSLLIAYFKSK